MKRLMALAVVIFALQAVATFGGEPVGSSTQVTPPPSFFRPNSIQERSGPLLQALDPAQIPASTLGGEAWIPLGSPGNMPVSGSKGRGQLAVEVAQALPARRGSALSSLAADCRCKGASSVKTSPFLFLGGSRGMFSLRRPQEEAARPENEGGRALVLLPSWSSRLVAGGPFEKTAKIKRCNIVFLA